MGEAKVVERAEAVRVAGKVGVVTVVAKVVATRRWRWWWW